MEAKQEGIDSETKNKLWKELKLKWSALKRNSNSNDAQKAAAKKRINEIQDELGLDKTDFEAPYDGGNSKKATKEVQNEGGVVNQMAGISVDTQKIIAAINQKAHNIEEKLDHIISILEHNKVADFDTKDIPK